jgi:hypothetical protein
MTILLRYGRFGMGHTPAPNWEFFLEFAGRYLHGPISGAK